MTNVLARLARKVTLKAMLAALGLAAALFVVDSDRGTDALLASRHEHILGDAPAIDPAPGSDDDSSASVLGGIMFDDVGTI